MLLLFQLVDCEINKAKLPEYRMDLERVAKLSFEAEERFKILTFIHDQLIAADWRKIWNALNILQTLFTSGSKMMISEFAQGQHFDALQRLLLLTAFAHDDLRIRELVRSRAREVREIAKDKLEASNISSPDERPSPSGPSAAPVSQRKLLSTAPVYIGHNSDTDDDDDNPPVLASGNSFAALPSTIVPRADSSLDYLFAAQSTVPPPQQPAKTPDLLDLL